MAEELGQRADSHKLAHRKVHVWNLSNEPLRNIKKSLYDNGDIQYAYNHETRSSEGDGFEFIESPRGSDPEA